MTVRFYNADPDQSRLRLNYTLHVSERDTYGKICVTSPDVPGLLIYAEPVAALADVPAAVALCRVLNYNKILSSQPQRELI